MSYILGKKSMQMQMPFFPDQTKLINSSVGFFKKGDFVYYLHNGSPIYCHSETDLNSYRFTLASLVENDLCTVGELSGSLGIEKRNVQRYVKTLRDKGTAWFFNREDNRGQCYRVTPEKKEEIQSLLDQGYSGYRAAKETGLSEGAIRYHLRAGTIKKKSTQN